jgi:hypothetical protein
MGDSYFGMSLNVGKIDTIPCSGLGVMLGDGSLPSLDYPIQDKEIFAKKFSISQCGKMQASWQNFIPQILWITWWWLRCTASDHKD